MIDDSCPAYEGEIKAQFVLTFFVRKYLQTDHFPEGIDSEKRYVIFGNFLRWFDGSQFEKWFMKFKNKNSFF
jgi:hypothetical protein